MTAKLSAFDNLRPNPEWARLPFFDRKGWTKVRFGDVVQNINETEHDPVQAGLERYIGLEHLEPGSMHIRSWGTVEDGTTFTRRCRPGQVLFGKRRAYQRKVAVAEFHAVVSGDIYVLDPKNDRLVPELLPFLCTTERFVNHAVVTSAGSLSPRTNWSSLAGFEFDLPPLDQQRRIAEILWNMDEAVQQISALEAASQDLANASLSDFLYDYEHWPEFECRDILVDGPRNGFSPPVKAGGTGLPTLSISAIRGGEVVTEGSLKFADVALEDVARFQLNPGDILVVRGNGNRSLCGKAGIVRSYPEGCFYPDLLIRLRFKPEAILQDFAVMQWNEPKTHTRLISKAKSTNGIWKINGKDIRSHRLALPPITAQERFLGAMRPKQELIGCLMVYYSKAVELRNQLINAIFRGQL